MVTPGGALLAPLVEQAITSGTEVLLNKASGREKDPLQYATDFAVGLVANYAGDFAVKAVGGKVLKNLTGLTPIDELSGAAANPYNWANPTSIKSIFTGNQVKRLYVDELVAFPFSTFVETAGSLFEFK